MAGTGYALSIGKETAGLHRRVSVLVLIESAIGGTEGTYELQLTLVVGREANKDTACTSLTVHRPCFALLTFVYIGLKVVYFICKCGDTNYLLYKF